LIDNAGTIHLGVVGCGRVTAERHLPALREVPQVEVVAFSDVNATQLETIGAQFGVSRLYTDYQRLIADDKIKAVAVCVPPALHTEVALAALAAGKHVFIEKPLALKLEECDLLLERAAKNDGLKVMVGFNLRWHPLVREAREIVNRGDLGEIKLVRTVFTSVMRARDDSPAWRMKRESGGGALFELGIHHFDLLWFLLGSEPEETAALSAPDDETATVVVRMAGGAQVVAAFSEATAENQELEIYGERGWLRLSCYRADGLEQFSVSQNPGALATRLRKLSRTLRELPRMVRQSRRGGDYVASYAEEWRHFAGAILSDTPTECSLADGRRALAFALAAWEASSLGRAVKSEQGKAVGTY